MNTLKDVKDRVRRICGDPEGDWLTDEYLIGLINHVYDLQVNYLSNTCSPYITLTKVVPSLPAGTTTLQPFQADANQPLYGLITPLEMDWKPSGQPDTWYRPAFEREVLPDVIPGSMPQFGMFWKWESFVLYVTSMNCLIDIRVRGEFKPPPLFKDSDIVQVHPNLAGALAEETAAAAFRERANPGQVQAYSIVGGPALDDIASQLIRKQQGTQVRLARANSRRRRGWW